jgi:protein SCO1/2
MSAKAKRAALSTAFLIQMLFYQPAFGHAGEDHSAEGIEPDITAVEENAVLPFDIGGPFSLLDHNGQPVTEKSFPGKHLLVFFGYTNCQIMCSISLSRIGEALHLLDADEDNWQQRLVPLVVTVDPESDTPDQLKTTLMRYHPALIGLTGATENLAQMYSAYKQKPARLEHTMAGKPVVSHASYFHLLDPQGQLKTLFPPILNAAGMAGILKKHLAAWQQ